MGDLLLGPGAFKVTQFAADADWDVMQSIGKGELVRIAFPIYVHALDALAKVPITTFNDFAISLPHLTTATRYRRVNVVLRAVGTPAFSSLELAHVRIFPS